MLESACRCEPLAPVRLPPVMADVPAMLAYAPQQQHVMADVPVMLTYALPQQHVMADVPSMLAYAPQQHQRTSSSRSQRTSTSSMHGEPPLCTYVVP